MAPQANRLDLHCFGVLVQSAFVRAQIWLISGTSIIYQGWTSWVALSLRGASYSDASMALSETGPVASVLVNPVELTVAVKQIPGHLADRVGA